MNTRTRLGYAVLMVIVAGCDAGAGHGSLDQPFAEGVAGAAPQADVAASAQELKKPKPPSNPTGGSAAPTPDAGTPTPPARSTPWVGVYVGNDLAALAQFESWLGRPVDGVLAYTGHQSWSDFDGSAPWAVELWSRVDRRVLWSIPLIPSGATLEEAARGTYNDHYRKVAELLVGTRPQDPQIHVRVGWECNGGWFPWSAVGKPAAYIGAFRQFVTTFRSVAQARGTPGRFAFEWNSNIGDGTIDPVTAYPGDEYVDVIGMDFYWFAQWDSSDPAVAWNQKVTQPRGLQWHQDFAAAHGKRTSYSEWGVQFDNAGYYIEQAKAWFERHNVVFHTYWNSNAAYPGKLSGGQYPSTGAAYRTAFRAQ